MKKSAQQPYEGMIAEDLNPQGQFMGPMAVVYYEGIRGNHFLFSEIDQQVTDSNSLRTWSSEERERLSGIGLRFLSCGDVRSLRGFIQKLTNQDRSNLFLLYLQFLQSWRHQVKSSLN